MYLPDVTGYYKTRIWSMSRVWCDEVKWTGGYGFDNLNN